MNANSGETTPLQLNSAWQKRENLNLLQKPKHGQVLGLAIGQTPSYRSKDGYTGEDSFTLQAKLPRGSKVQFPKQTITVFVKLAAPENTQGEDTGASTVPAAPASPVQIQGAQPRGAQPQAPVAEPQIPVTHPQKVVVPATVNFNTPTTIPVDDPTRSKIATQAEHGLAQIEKGHLTYTPVAGYSGPDEFTYTVSSADQPRTVEVTVGIQPRNLRSYIAPGLASVCLVWAVVQFFQVRRLSSDLGEVIAKENSSRDSFQTTDPDTEKRLASLEREVSELTQPRRPSNPPKERPKATLIRPPELKVEAEETPSIARPAALPAVDPPSRGWRRSGDLLQDYNRARALGAEAQNLFMTGYPEWRWLSCENLTDRRSDPTAELHMSEVTRGVFMGVEDRGHIFVVPAFYIDLDARSSLEGVFNYLCDPSDATGLLRPAQVHRSSTGFRLGNRDTGEIGRV